MSDRTYRTYWTGNQSFLTPRRALAVATRPQGPLPGDKLRSPVLISIDGIDQPDRHQAAKDNQHGTDDFDPIREGS